MGWQSLTVSETGQEKIKEAINHKGWKIKAENTRPLIEASLLFIEQYQKSNRLDKNDFRWLKDFEHLFRVEKHQKQNKDEVSQKINQLKVKIASSKELNFLQHIKSLVEKGEILIQGISYGSWSKFASKTRRHSINEKAFIAYCEILDLCWHDIAEDSSSKKTSALLPVPDSLFPYTNLPCPHHTALIGRDEQLIQLLNWLEPNNHVYRVSVDGVIGGSGKTSLVWEAANCCLQASKGLDTTFNAPKFNAIIFTSAKQKIISSGRILPCHLQQRTLSDIFHAIAYTLQCRDILVGDFSEIRKRILEKLSEQSTLLIIDNLDTVEDVDSILSFLYELPLTVKTVITSRLQTPLDQRICLRSLSRKDTYELIQHLGQSQDVSLSHEELQALYEQTGGVPGAIVFVIGQLATGYTPEDICPRMKLPTSDYCRFYIESSVQQLKGQVAYSLLMLLSMFPKPLTQEMLGYVMGIQDLNTVADALAQLQRRSLIYCDNKRYDSLPLIQEYVITQLNLDPDFKTNVRTQAVNWYLNFITQHGESNWQEWNNYQFLEQEWENLRIAIEWCIYGNCYEDFKQFWSYLRGFTHLYGYWRDRLNWMEWLRKVAHQRLDWTTEVEAMFDIGRTLLLINQPQQQQEALELFEQALYLCQQKQHLCQFDLVINIAVVQIYRQCFDQAITWLERVNNLLIQTPPEEPSRQRIRVQVLYYFGEIYFKTGDYKQAKSWYQEALKTAKIINWKRAIAYIQIWLALIAIEQGDLTNAESLLNQNYTLVEQNNDKRCIAFCKRAFALLNKAQGNHERSCEWAAKAQKDFNSLGMIQEVQEMKSIVSI